MLVTNDRRDGIFLMGNERAVRRIENVNLHVNTTRGRKLIVELLATTRISAFVVYDMLHSCHVPPASAPAQPRWRLVACLQAVTCTQTISYCMQYYTFFFTSNSSPLCFIIIKGIVIVKIPILTDKKYIIC